MTPLPDDALVVRGGLNRPENFVSKSHAGAFGVSVEAAGGATVAELAAPLPHGQVGVTTVGAVRAAGGDVVPTPGRSPNHATLVGLDAVAASLLFTPTVPNPTKPKKSS